MESESNSHRIEKLNDTNYFAWKIRIFHILALKDLEDCLNEDPPEDATERVTWQKKDKKAQEIIGLSINDDLLAKAREVSSAKEMWSAIKNVFERHTLLNRLSARRKFYTVSKI